MSRMRGTPTLGPYSRTDSRPGRLADSGSTLIAPDTPSMSKVSTTAHRVSPGQIPLTGHLPLASRSYTAVIPTAYPVIPATAGIQGWRGWVPVSTGTTGGRASLPSFLPNQYFAFPSFPRRKTPAQPSFPRRRESRGGGDGFPSPRERRAAARPYRHARQTRTSHFRHSRAGRPLHNRHSRESGNPGAAGMGSRLHGNDGRQRVPTVIPAKPVLRISVIPAQEDLAYPSFPRRRESRGGEEGSRLHGNDGRRRTPSPPQVHLPAASISYRRYENWKA